MSPILSGIVPTTELEAVNTMLSAIGEAPATQAQIVSPTAIDLVMAINILRNVTRETLSLGWRFNMEFGFELTPTGTPVTFNFRDSTPSILLNIFTPPTGLAKFRISRPVAQIGSHWVDAVLRPPRTLDPTTYPLVFYDRTNNRDGWDSTLYPVLYIDPVWYFDFNLLPEAARRYVAIRAARQLIQQVVGAQELSAFSEKDELYALRTLKRDEGDEDDRCNVFDFAMDTPSFLGNRTSYLTGVLDPRSNVGAAPLFVITLTQTRFEGVYSINTPVQFTASGTDALGGLVGIPYIVWSASVGTISDEGLWTPPSDGFTGAATITATSGTVVGTKALAYVV